MKKDKLVLSIETSLKEGSLSLLCGDAELGSWKGNEVVSRSEDLVSGIQEIFEKSHKSMCDLNLIAVSVGPGSFTGLRVGIAIGKGLAYALNCRLVGIPILHCLAFFYTQKSFPKKKITCLVGAGRGQVYSQIFGSAGGFFKALSDIRLMSDSQMSEQLMADSDSAVVCEANMHLNLVDLKEPGVDLIAIRDNISRYIGQYAQSLEDGVVEDPALIAGAVTPIYVRDL